MFNPSLPGLCFLISILPGRPDSVCTPTKQAAASGYVICETRHYLDPQQNKGIQPQFESLCGRKQGEKRQLRRVHGSHAT